MESIMAGEAATRRFVRDLLIRHGADEEEGGTAADALIWSDMRGLESHGLCRLPAIVERLVAGGIVSPCRAEVQKLSHVAELLDGHGGFGQHLGALAARRAAALAREEGIAVIAVRNSNHFGAAGYYADIAAREGVAALVTSNSFPAVAAPGGLRPVLGTNPLAFAAPRAGMEPLIVDMGTTFRSRIATVTRASRAGTVEAGMAVDAQGRPVGDSGKLRDATLLPRDPKDFALGLVVEVLSGVLTGAGYSKRLHSFYRDTGRPGNLGHLVIALCPDIFMPRETFLQRMEHLIELLMSSGDMSPESPVRIPGEKRWHSHRRNRALGVVPLDKETAAALEGLAQRVGLAPPWQADQAAAGRKSTS